MPHDRAAMPHKSVSTTSLHVTPCVSPPLLGHRSQAHRENHCELLDGQLDQCSSLLKLIIHLQRHALNKRRRCCGKAELLIILFRHHCLQVG